MRSKGNAQCSIMRNCASTQQSCNTLLPAGYSIAVNNLPLIIDDECKVLILGTFPAPLSRKYGFYYCNTNNRFWEILEAIFEEKVPWCICHRREYLLKHHVALWDIGACCKVKDASDKYVDILVMNPICCLLNKIQSNKGIAVFCNGGKAYKKYNSLIKPNVISNNTSFTSEAIPLQSSSSANRKCDFQKAVADWKDISEYIEGNLTIGDILAKKHINKRQKVVNTKNNKP